MPSTASSNVPRLPTRAVKLDRVIDAHRLILVLLLIDT